MKRVFVSVPMRDKTDEEIKQAIIKLHQIAELLEGQRLTLVDNFEPDTPCNSDKDALHLLSKVLDKMAECDVFIGVKTWGYRGCISEMSVANDYGLKVYTIDYKYIFGEFEHHDDDVKEATNECMGNNH